MIIPLLLVYIYVIIKPFAYTVRLWNSEIYHGLCHVYNRNLVYCSIYAEVATSKSEQ